MYAEAAEHSVFLKALDCFSQPEERAWLSPSKLDGGKLFVQEGGSYCKGEPIGVPSLVIAAEHYGRLFRLLQQKIPVELELHVQNRFLADDEPGYNVIADLPGDDPKLNERGMFGGHLDSWHGGTGTVDDGAGVVVALEVMRIFQALQNTPVAPSGWYCGATRSRALGRLDMCKNISAPSPSLQLTK